MKTEEKLDMVLSRVGTLRRRLRDRLGVAFQTYGVGVTPTDILGGGQPHRAGGDKVDRVAESEQPLVATESLAPNRFAVPRAQLMPIRSAIAGLLDSMSYRELAEASARESAERAKLLELEHQRAEAAEAEKKKEFKPALL